MAPSWAAGQDAPAGEGFGEGGEVGFRVRLVAMFQTERMLRPAAGLFSPSPELAPLSPGRSPASLLRLPAGSMLPIGCLLVCGRAVVSGLAGSRTASASQ